MSSSYSLTSLLGANLLTAAGGSVATKELEGAVVALYFSAKWCPPCKVFTPILSASRTAALAAGARFEVVFVSSDHDAEGFSEYFGAMSGWNALQFEGEEAEAKRAEIKTEFGCKGIPQLSVLRPQADGSYQLVTNEGKNLVMKEREKQILAWCEAPAKEAAAASESANSPAAAAAPAFSMTEDF